MLSQTKHNPNRTAFHFPHAAPLEYTLTASLVKASANSGDASSIIGGGRVVLPPPTRIAEEVISMQYWNPYSGGSN
jgi:hypothetical protein